MLYQTGFELTASVVICTDCPGSCKSNYHRITTTTAPLEYLYISKHVVSTMISLIRGLLLTRKLLNQEWWQYLTWTFVQVEGN